MKINKKKAAYWKKINEANEWIDFMNKISQTHNVEIHPIHGDPFGDGIPRCVTIISNKNY